MNCPKHVEFYSKNKIEKLVHLVGFVIRIFHDARSPERQTDFSSLYKIFTLTALIHVGFSITVSLKQVEKLSRL